MSLPPPTGCEPWSIFGTSVTGAAHTRKGLPNQDALNWFPRTPGRFGPPLVCAVADGHGSSKCFRSATGSALATICAKEVGRKFLREHPDLPDPQMEQRLAEHLPFELVRTWKTRVGRDLEEHPLLAAELDELEQDAGSESRTQVLANPSLAYGTTLLLAMVMPRGLALLQLGDGDILLVATNGSTRRPLPKDPRLIGNETTSLCNPHAERDFRSAWLPFTQPAPALLLLSTDGYSNSFQNDTAFLQVGSDLFTFLRDEGLRSVRRSLEGWLDEASRLGSGDDITLAVLYRCAAIQPEQDCATIPYASAIDAQLLEEKTDD